MMSYFDPPKKPTVLVTGAGSFLGSLIVANLLNQDYIVRGTTRCLKTFSIDLSSITALRLKSLFLFEADLLDPESTWHNIIEGCDYIIHAASPNDVLEPKDYKNLLIKPTVEGIEKIFTLGLKLNVKKIVFISCITTIVTSDKKEYIFSEKDWADPKKLNKLALSKLLAEQKAWEIYSMNKDKISFTSLVPGLMMGPSLKSVENVSTLLFQKCFDKKVFNKIPHISFPFVDVRDVAAASVIVIQKNEISNGKRYLLVQGSYWWEDVANIVRGEFEKYGYDIPKNKMSSFWIKIKALWNPLLSFIKPYLEGELIIDTSLFINEIAMPYRKIEETFIEFGYDLIKKKLIEDKLFFMGDDKDPPYLH